MIKVLNVTKFDKKDIKNDSVLLLFNELEAIKGKENEELKRKFYLFFIFRNRPKERDVSEQIALGVQSASDTGVQYDQRLFNMSAVRIWLFVSVPIIKCFFSRVLVVV
jgi:hypothetical protein